MKWEQRVTALEEHENPWPLIWWGVKWLAILGAILLAFRIVCAPLNYAGRVATVVSNEIDPAVLLQKYMWFKDARAALDAKVATIRVYESRRARLERQYGTASRWPRDVREEWSLQESEVSGVVASYNTLAADYNAQMAKINWRFTNRGQLPAGATETFPREYAPYKESQ